MLRSSRSLLFVSLVATLVAVWLVSSPAYDNNAMLGGEHHTGQTADRTSATAPSVVYGTHRTVTGGAATETSHVRVLRIRPRDNGNENESRGGDARLFASTQWAQPSKSMPMPDAVPVANLPPLSPQAPPLPFRVFGRYEETGRTAFFLQYNDQNLVVRLGDIIAEQYKVESLDNTALTLRYLPLNKAQVLTVSDLKQKKP